MFNRENGVAEYATQNGKTARETAKKNRKGTTKQLKDVQRQAKATRRDWTLRLNNLARDMRWEIEHLLDDEDKKRADRVAHDLEKIASNIEKRAQFQLQDAKLAARKNVWQTILMTFVIGVIIGVILRNSND